MSTSQAQDHQLNKIELYAQPFGDESAPMLLLIAEAGR
jgi:hypothetical protein